MEFDETGTANVKLADRLISLTPAQEVAIEVLIGGGTQCEAASAAGVRRETVSRWVSGHPGFRAALDRSRWTAAVETEHRMAALRQTAVSIVKRQLDALDPDDPRALTAALAVLRVVAAPRPAPPESAAENLSQQLRSGERRRSDIIMEVGYGMTMHHADALQEITAAAAVGDE